ncbi:MAG: hypothetical protein WCK86_15335 [Planctomycetia bacterium]
MERRRLGHESQKRGLKTLTFSIKTRFIARISANYVPDTCQDGLDPN